MTPQEQQQVNAAMAYMEQQCADLARAGANKAIQCEVLAQQLKAAQARIAELTPKDEPPVFENVVPIGKEPA